jgi:hypothetical protein
MRSPLIQMVTTKGNQVAYLGNLRGRGSQAYTTHRFLVLLGILGLGLLVVLLSLYLFTTEANAQSLDDEWSPPVNLSNSGAASQSRIVSGQDGTLQVFWWDRFDGLMTSLNYPGEDGDLSWSEPLIVPISSDTVPNSLQFVVDTEDWVHAFWIERNQKEEVSLNYGMFPLGSTGWSGIDVLAESVGTFDVLLTKNGQVLVAYIQTQDYGSALAGVYVQKVAPDFAPQSVNTNRYYRLVTPGDGYLDLAEAFDKDNDSYLYLAWDAPQGERTLFSVAISDGGEWTQPLPVGRQDLLPKFPRLATLGNGVNYIIWQAGAQSGCTLYQQLQDLLDLWAATYDPQVGSLLTESSVSKVYEASLDCPVSSRFFNLGDQLLWLRGEGSSSLSLSGWDSSLSAWSLSQSLGFHFEDPETGSLILLDDLNTALVGEQLAVIGVDQEYGDVWFTQVRFSTAELAFAPPPVWSSPQRIGAASKISHLTTTMDQTGRAHVFWSQESEPANMSSSLQYASTIVYSNMWAVAQIIPATTGQSHLYPSLSYDAEEQRLHLTWSGGADNQVYYSRANLNEAVSPGGWSPPRMLSSAGVTAWPQIDHDSAGNLYIAYSVPLNEGRGVYLLRSQDKGSSWSEPIQIFDAVADNWQMVDHPALVVSQAGVIHLAWVEASLPGMDGPRSIRYVRSKDGGQTWSKPAVVAGSGYDWPRLALSGDQIHLLFASAGMDGYTLSHRWAEETLERSWSTAATISGWKGIAVPYGLVAWRAEGDGVWELHLAGASAKDGLLHHAVWNGQRWSAVDSLDASELIGPGLAVQLAAYPEGNGLVASWLASSMEDNKAEQSLYTTTLRLSSQETSQLTAAPTPQAPEVPVVVSEVDESLAVLPEPTLVPTLELTATPHLSQSPSASPSQMPVVMGGSLAALIVAGTYAGWMLWGRGKSFFRK